DQLFRVLADVDESAATGYSTAEAAGIDIAGGVAFAKTEEGGIEAAAIDEVECGAVIDDGLVVHGGAEVQAAHRDTADDAGIDRQGQQIGDAFLARYQRHLVGYRADADIDDTVRRELEQGAPGNDLSIIELDRADHLLRHAQLTG